MNIRKNFILSLCQMKTTSNKETNLKRAEELVTSSVKLFKSNVVVLPEFFNSPYDMKQVPTYAEVESESTTLGFLKNLAKSLDVYLVGGSIPEKENNNYFNTCYCIDRSGQVVAKHRKVHLFDIDIPGKITYKESSILKAGNQLTVFDTEYCKFGIGICYDIRFPEYSQSLKNKGVDFLVFPGAFNTVTGPLHWELLQRGRALDNNCFVATCSPCRNTEDPNSYQAWGNSMVVDPFGKVVSSIGYEEGVLQSNINLSLIDDIAQQIPTFKQKREDVYELKKI